MDRRTEKLLHKLELYYSFDFASGCHKMVIVFVLDDQLLKYIAFLDCSNSTFFTLEIKISLICQISVEVVTARTGVHRCQQAESPKFAVLYALHLLPVRRKFSSED